MLSHVIRPTMLLATALMLVAFAQTASSEGVSPESKMDGALQTVFALSAAQASDAAGSPLPLSGSVAMYDGGSLVDGETARSADAGGELEIGVLVKTGGDADEIAATGASVGSQVGEIVTARATLDEVWSIAALDDVSALEASIITKPDSIVAPPARIDGVREPALDTTPDFLGLNTWHDAGLTGDSVAVGVIDTGIWPEHPSFRDDGGDSIIHSAWDQTNPSGPPPPGFATGTFWSAQHFDDGTANVTDTNGHGTGLAGVAFGQPFEGTTGIAPGATPVIVKTTFATADLLDGVEFVHQQALNQGDLAIINMSLGTHFGAHDGTSLFEQGLSGFVDQGVAVVGSAGNDGNTDIHTWFDMTPGGMATPTIGMPQSSGPTNLLFSFYFDGSDVCMGVGTPNGFGTTAPLCQGDSIGVDTDDGCFIVANTGPDPNNGKSQIIVNVFGEQFGCTVPIAGGDWSLFFDGSDVGLTTKVDGWSADGVAFSNGWGDNRSTVHIPATSADVFAVGGFVTRESYEAADGHKYSFDPFSETGTLVGSSSRGPNADGLTKPDITAPGAIVKTPLSQDANLPLANQFPGGLFQAISGTSMSSPHVAGVMALVRSQYPNASVDELRSALTATATADIFSGAVPNNDWGAGKLTLASLPHSDNINNPFSVASYEAYYWTLSLTGTEPDEPTGACTQEIYNTAWLDISQLASQQERVIGSRWGDYSGVINTYTGSGAFDSLMPQDCNTYAANGDVRFRGLNREGPNPPDTVQIGTFLPVIIKSAGAEPLTGPVVEFSIQPAQTVPWGDLDCDGDADSVDALKTLQNAAGIAVNQDGCPEFESDAFAVDNDDDGPAVIWGDLDCDGDSDSVDALKALQNVAGVGVNQPPDCPELGEEVLVPA